MMNRTRFISRRRRDFFELHFDVPPLAYLIRTVALGLIALLLFGLFEQWPKRADDGGSRGARIPGPEHRSSTQTARVE